MIQLMPPSKTMNVEFIGVKVIGLLTVLFETLIAAQYQWYEKNIYPNDEKFSNPFQKSRQMKERFHKSCPRFRKNKLKNKVHLIDDNNNDDNENSAYSLSSASDDTENDQQDLFEKALIDENNE